MSNGGRRLKVAHIINSIGTAGAEMVVLDIVSHIDTNRFEPIVYVLDDVSVSKPTLFSRFHDAHVTVVLLRPGHTSSIWDAMRALRASFVKDRPDIVHCHLPNAVIAGSVAALVSRIPFIMHEHQDHAFHSWKIKLVYRILRFFAAYTICYNTTLEKEIFGLSNEYAAIPSSVVGTHCTIENGVDVDRVRDVMRHTNRSSTRSCFGIGESDILITSTARFVEWKGHRLLIEAFAQIAASFPNARLLIVGEGPTRPELLSLIRELSLEQRIMAPGARSDVFDILAASDIFSMAFTFPRGAEAGQAISISAFEAMAFGLPIIVSDYPTAAKFVENNVSALCVEPHNKQMLVDALVRLICDEDLRKRLGIAAQRYIMENKDWNAIITIYETVYTQLLKRS